VNIRRFAHTFLLAAVTFLPLNAAAQTIRILVGLAPGGSNDIAARLVADKLRDSLGQPVIVENKVGAGQRVALAEVKRAAPDGRTLILATNSPLSIFPHTYAKLEYDPVRDFTPIARVLTFDMAIAAGPKVAATNMKEFLAWVKANPAQAAYGTPGAGTLPHFVGVLLGRTVGVEFTHVPYKGSTSAMPDLMGGQVPILIDGLGSMAEQHKAGRIHFIASTGQKRSPVTPEVPTLRESGIDIVAETSAGIYGPARMPADIVKRLNGAIVQAVNAPDFRERLFKEGLTPSPSTPEELAASQAEDLKRWEAPIKASGFKASD
jgi:tripartite-type tricarboxylate transporter receptor subunit TctC